MKALFVLPFMFVFASLSYSQDLSSDLFSISKIKTEIQSKQVSSFDTTGCNADRWMVGKGETATILDVKDAGVINRIWFTIASTGGKLLRNDIVIRMYWDGNSFPSVETPIGPFFGQGWDESYHFISAPLAAAPRDGNAMVSYFSMPFKKGARIEIENQSDAGIKLYFSIDYTAMKQLPPDLGRFHAWYNYEVTNTNPEGENEWAILGEQGKNNDAKNNYLIANIKGKGQFVGVNYFVNSPTPMWYGEGDEMIFIDGEKHPSIIGTGTEDFFNSSWCPKEIYMHPNFGYPRVNAGETGFLGRTHCYRFFINDPVYFDKSCNFTIEHGHNNCLTLELSTVAYWYQSEAVQVPAIIGVNVRKPKPTISAWDIHKWRDAWRKTKGSDPKLWGNE